MFLRNFFNEFYLNLRIFLNELFVLRYALARCGMVLGCVPRHNSGSMKKNELREKCQGHVETRLKKCTMLKRKIESVLRDWKAKPSRKPMSFKGTYSGTKVRFSRISLQTFSPRWGADYITTTRIPGLRWIS